MKHIMIIDGADNCSYDIFAATDEEFAMFFPGDGQDIAFIDEIWPNDDDSDDDADSGPPEIREAFDKLWTRPVDKKNAQGIHGTIFYQLALKKKFYPNRRDSDLRRPFPTVRSTLIVED